MNSIAARSRQDGMTYIGMLIMLVVIAFFAIVLIKVLPLYLEHFKVDSSLESLGKESKDDPMALSSMEIEKHLLNRLNINDVQHVTKDDIKITREGRKTNELKKLILLIVFYLMCQSIFLFVEL